MSIETMFYIINTFAEMDSNGANLNTYKIR